MPIYEYLCGACGHQEEVIQKISDNPLTKCPACGKNKLQKQVSSPAFQLKGEGWYVTDFKNKKPAAMPEPETSTKTETTPETKLETKPPKSTEKKTE